jgi:hypothetical protein
MAICAERALDQPEESDMPIDNANAVRGPIPIRDALLILGLIGLDVLARVVPHAPNFAPAAAPALFASLILQRRALAFAVPLGAMLLSDYLLGFSDWRMTIAVYGSLMFPAALGLLARRRLEPHFVYALASVSSLAFYAVTNFAVWTFSGMYSHDTAGLLDCYILALPFFRNTLAADLLWITALFAAYWVWRFALSVPGATAAAHSELPGR